MSHTIELRKVSKYYTEEDSVSMGISRVDLDLDIGEFVAITGESGSGKSTLLNVISGLDSYEEGELFVCGEDTASYGTEDYERYRKTYIGNIFQDFNLINSYTVYENIETVMLLLGKSREECKERVNQLIDKVDMSEYRNTKASKLSGGQKQRVAIARALAKDAPIIVADEPTGNLDSESAVAIMAILAEVSKDKLVVIVTHNYEQAEPYVTRKITMHDGKIIEDKRVYRADNEGDLSVDELYRRLAETAGVKEPSPQPEVPAPGNMSLASEVRLGVRNTFNLPAKFILLFVVYLFVSIAVLGQYATEKNSMHETDMLGSNPYFVNTNAERVIVKKADDSSFTDKDIDVVRGIPNVKDVVRNDVALDSGASISLGDMIIEGPVVSFDQIDASKITYGHLPRGDNEILIRVDSSTDAYISLSGSGSEYVGTKVVFNDINQKQAYDLPDNITIAGFILDSNSSGDLGYSLYGYSTIYVSDAVSNELLSSMMANVSVAEMDFDGTISVNDYGRAVYPSPSVPDGKVYLFEDQKYYYDDEKAEGKNFALKVKNRFFESEGKYTVDKVVTTDNCKKLLGISKDDYDNYFNCVFISTNDFRKLFDKGLYQISVFMLNEQESEDVQQALNEKGFKTMMLKDSLTDSMGEIGEVLDLVTYGRLALEFLLIFFVAYSVIRLIMRSRKPYYSTLRMLGATQRNITNILRTELVLMMLITYGLVVLAALLISNGMLQDVTGHEMAELNKLLYYLTPLDYGILGALMLLMSWLIAGRYSKRIFAQSAMKTFREEV